MVKVAAKGPNRVMYRARGKTETGYITHDYCVLDADFKLVGRVAFSLSRWVATADPEAFNNRPPVSERRYLKLEDAAKWLLEAQQARLGL